MLKNGYPSTTNEHSNMSVKLPLPLCYQIITKDVPTLRNGKTRIQQALRMGSSC
jgi:hypothetical protein